MLSRRDFISLLTVAGLSPLILNSKDLDGNRNKYYFDENPENYKQKSSTRILPNALRPGSKIAITAPASPTSLGEIAETVRILKNLGCIVEVGDTIKNKTSSFRYLSNSDDTRAKEFMSFVERKDIDCILCGRGGYGVMRILNLLDFEKIKNNPKIIMGFSDITALINSIFNITGLVSFHGPVASTPFDNFTLGYFKKVVYQNSNFTPIEFHSDNITVINNGEAQGKLVGGNLRMLIS
ncbi:MAG: LD-carboxypeptidase [Candidatus Kapabacteria bacterium]|nr:LD-carboxypeptidase [Candidatus Kapabacteria bacterium]